MSNLRIIILSILFLASLSCVKEGGDDVSQYDALLTAEGNDILCLSSDGTKTALNPQLKVVWNQQDRIRLFSDEAAEGESYYIKEISEDRITAVFSASQTPVTGDLRYAVYPDAAFRNYDRDKGTVKLDISSFGGPDVSGLPMVSSSKGSLFSFVNVCGGIMVRPYDIQNMGLMIKSLKAVSKDGKAIGSVLTVDLESMSVLSCEGESDFVELTLAEPQDISSYGWTSWSTHASSVFASSAKEFVIYVPCGEYPAGFDIVLTDEQGRSYTYETGPQTISPGIINRLPYISLITYYGSENSVRVDPGVKSVDIDVTPYYTFSRNFERDNKMVISDSPIVSSAQVLWQQEYGCKADDIMATASSGTVVSSSGTLQLSKSDDGMQKLTVPLTGVSGNAVVAVTDSEGTVLWSFHIWVSEAEDVPCKTDIGGDYILMDRNLGATSADDFNQTTEQLVRNSFGLFYQWGRKDPFPRILHRDARVTANTYSATLPFTNSITRSDRIVGSISHTIRNPHKRIWLASSGCNWLMSYIGELWGFHYSNGSIDRLVSENQSRDGVKTVYDPCPAGYKVADAKHIKGLVDLNEGKLTDRNKYYGYYFDTGASVTTYIPASGWVKSSDPDASALKYEGYWGMLWSSASTLMNVHYMYLHADSSAVFADSHTCVRGNMCPVRCVKIEQ